mmetsp:Transcript_17588/g.30290  ORF Transcript_17588/g.30290 Transcript_17588/m.30290 type:complete len:331 (+) Transcript_17588:114-1106(+)
MADDNVSCCSSGSSSSSASLDSNDPDVAFALMDFSGVDFGDDQKNEKKKDDDDAGELTATAHVDDEEEAEAPKTAAASEESKVEQPRQADQPPKRRNSRTQQPKFEMPSGQIPPKGARQHDTQLFLAQERRVFNLIKWYELGIRPSLTNKKVDPLDHAAHHGKDDDLFAAQADNLAQLLHRSIVAQDELNTNLPPFPLTPYEDHLEVKPSTIPNAGNGLFTTKFIPKSTPICHYTGYRHHYQSQKRLPNGAYVLKLQNDGFVDPLPTLDVKARFMNDIRNEDQYNVKFEYIQSPEIWHCPVVSLRDIEAGEELFVCYGPRYWNESRGIGG